MSKLKLGEESSESTGQSGDSESVTSEAEGTNVSSASTDSATRSSATCHSASKGDDHSPSAVERSDENLNSKFHDGKHNRNFTPFASAFLMYNRGQSLRTAAPVPREMTFDTFNFNQDEYPQIDMSAYEDYLKPIYKDGDVLLEIECGENKAMLYLSKLCQGSKGPCILFDDMWLTPNEFQYISGRETAKDWKRSIRHHGKSMKLLLSKGILAVHPPICDCEGCRISSPVNRCRLAEKRTAPPPTEKHVSKRKKVLGIPSWGSLSKNLRISDTDRKRKHSANFDSSSNDEDSSERIKTLKSPDPEGKRESRLTSIIDQLLHNKKKGLQDENNSTKTTVAQHENPVIKEDLDNREENGSENIIREYSNSTTESDDSSSDGTISDRTSPMIHQSSDIKLEEENKTKSEENPEEFNNSVKSEQDLSLTVKSETSHKDCVESSTNDQSGDIQTEPKPECQEQTLPKIEETRVKQERHSPDPSVEVSDIAATLLPPEAYLQAGSTHLVNRFHYLPYTHSHFFPLSLPFDKTSSATSYTKLAMKQLDMMSRNYSEYIRNLAAKYNGDNTAKLNELNKVLRSYEEQYRAQAMNPIAFHLPGQELCRNWTADNQIAPFYADQQRLHSNMRMVELQSSPALAQLIKNSYMHAPTHHRPEAQSCSQGLKRRRSMENRSMENRSMENRSMENRSMENLNDALDLSTDKKSREETITKLSSDCVTNSSTSEDTKNPQHQNLRDLLGHNPNEKLKDNKESRKAHKNTNEFINTGTSGGSTVTVTKCKRPKITNCVKQRINQRCPENPDGSNLSQWTVRDVYNFVKSIAACTDYAEMFREHSIDGTALPLLTEDHLMNNMGMKLGPAIKLRAVIANKFGNCNTCMHCLHCHNSNNPSEKRCASN